MSMLDVGIYLKTLRNTQGYTLNEVAAAAGVENRTVSTWEKGRNQPSLESSLKALKFLKGTWEDVRDLMNGVSKRSPGDLAKWRLQNPVVLTDEERLLLDGMPADQREAVFELIRRTRGTPR